MSNSLRSQGHNLSSDSLFYSSNKLWAFSYCHSSPEFIYFPLWGVLHSTVSTWINHRETRAGCRPERIRLSVANNKDREDRLLGTINHLYFQFSALSDVRPLVCGVRNNYLGRVVPEQPYLCSHGRHCHLSQQQTNISVFFFLYHTQHQNNASTLSTAGESERQKLRQKATQESFLMALNSSIMNFIMVTSALYLLTNHFKS